MLEELPPELPLQATPTVPTGGQGAVRRRCSSKKRPLESKDCLVKVSRARTDKAVCALSHASDTAGPSVTLSTCTEECTLCCNEAPPGHAARLGCRHGWYCIQCMTKHAEARLSEGAVDVSCPECRVSIPEHELKELLPAKVGKRLQARSLASAVSATADLRQCPTPDCPMVVALENDEEGASARFKCPLCRRISCLKCCAQPYHTGLSCRDAAEKRQTKGERELRRWMSETGTRQCPTCGMAVSKENLDRQTTQYKECHKMMCRVCRTRFCFKCLKVLTDTFTCGCSIDAHRFIDPVTLKTMPHLRSGRGRGRPPASPATASSQSGRGNGRGTRRR